MMSNEKLKVKLEWADPNLNVVIPMAGLGSRFENSGYSLPKPLININQQPMIRVAVDNLSIDANYIYIVQKKHRDICELDKILNLITPNCTIIETDGLTEGAACTALLAKKLINNNNPLFFANSDQFVEWESIKFFQKMNDVDYDGGIATFKATNPNYSFVKLDENGLVQEVAEKTPISDIATVGFYYWKLGSDFVKYAEQMISKDIRVNNEFYVCPIYNEAINDGKQIGTFMIDRFWSLGTPEDLNYYLEFYNK